MGTFPKTPLHMVLNRRQTFPQILPTNAGETDQKGDILHIFWGCPKLNIFWHDITTLISTISQTQIAVSPSLELLNLDIESLPHNTHHVIMHLLLAARLTIDRHWKSSPPPTLLETIWLTNTHHSYELLMVASSSGKLQHPVWSKVYWSRNDYVLPSTLLILL